MFDIEELKRLREEATPGPWLCQMDVYDGEYIIGVDAGLSNGKLRVVVTAHSDDKDFANTAFIVAAVNALPALLECIQTLESVNKSLEDCGAPETGAFEAWASSNGYDMQEHPLHWLFLDIKTHHARQGWKAALAHVRAAISGEGHAG